MSPNEPLDPAYSAAMARMEESGLRAGDPFAMPLAEARAQQDRYFAFLNQDPPGAVHTQDLTISGPHGTIPLRVYRKAGTETQRRPLPVLVFVRGSGWWAGGLDSHDRVMRLGALHSGCAVLGLDYRRTPEHRQPTQVDELLATVAWLRMQGVHHGLDGERCVLWGESAGATLILMATVRLRDEKAPLPKAMLLFYGNFDGPKPTLRAQSKWFWQQYLGGDMDHPDPAAIPARQVLRGLPSAWLGVGNLDPLLVDTLGMHERLAAAGVPCTLRRYPGLPHAFMNLTRLFPGAVDALDEAVSFALDALATPPASLEGKKPS